MKIRIISDVHNEFGLLYLPIQNGESKQVLVIAGDLGLAKRSHTFVDSLVEWCDRFRAVVYVLGNHEFYDSSITNAKNKIWKALWANDLVQNLHILEDDRVVIDDVSFIGSTLWSSFDNNSPMCKYEAQSWMNDYKLIRIGPSAAPYLKKFTPDDAYKKFLNSKNYIFGKLRDSGEKYVVVTHMGPSYKSVPEKYKTGPYAQLNGAYVSNLEEEILDTQPNLWIHGHTHDSFDYNIGTTRVVCNPRGYAGHELNPNFDPNMIVEV